MDRRSTRSVQRDRRTAGRHRKLTAGRRFTQGRALLAGALVLGVGATLTLAAWTDPEYASGSFATSTFGIEGAANGSSFSEHPSGSPGTVNFTTTAAALSPGAVAYGLFSVRTTTASTVGGVVSLGSATTSGDSGLLPKLSYGVRTVSGITCDATTYAAGTQVVAGGTLLTATISPASQTLANTTGAPGTAVNYCFAVTLASDAANSLQGKTATATWTFTATSSS